MSIEVGDLVMVVRCHCAEQEADVGGRIYVVESFEEPSTIECAQCGDHYGKGLAQVAFTNSRGIKGFHPTAWLKKIDPLSDPITQDEEITA